MRELSELQNLFVSELEGRTFGENPKSLYDPIHYILQLGGKRLRPVLTLLACEAFGKPAENAMEPAIGVELFHNFSLIHDDIMDNAPLRRGKQTVHEKWDVNVGILSGDMMLIEAYKHIAQVDKSILPNILNIFSKLSGEVCIGQQWDVDFETQTDVSEEQYIQMIQHKTSVLLGGALEIGALVAGASEDAAQKMYSFGLNLGTSFQIKDDLLDAFGDPEKFGKQVGGDILANKKTILLIHALNHATGSSKEQLEALLNGSLSGDEKVEAVKAIYREVGSVDYAEAQMKAYYDTALDALKQSAEMGADISHLESFAHYLYHRDH